MTAAEFIANSLAEVARLWAEYVEALEHVAMPGTVVYVLHDGRKGWMHGESGTVVWANEQWVEVMFREHGPRRFRLERLSRNPGGLDCWRGRLHAGNAAALLAPPR